MFEPITLAKVRQETKITVPAGGWIILGSPDQPLHEHIAKRAALVQDGHVNDDFEKLIIGRLQETHTPTRFVTAAQKTQADKAADAAQEDLAKSHKDALKRQAKADKTAVDSAAETHAEKVAALNKQNDAIRNRQ